MSGHIEDRWINKRSKEKTKLYGKGKRYKVAGIPGVRARSFTKLTDAKQWLAESTTESSRGGWIDPRAGDMPLVEYIEKHWWPNRVDPISTENSMRSRIWRHVIPPLGQFSLNAIGAAELRGWIAYLVGRLDPSTVHVVWNHLSSIMAAAVEDEKIRRNPVVQSRTVQLPEIPEKTPKVWAQERVVAVRAGLQERYRILVDLGVGNGLRQGEAFGFSPDDVDRENEVIHVRRQLRLDSRGRPYLCPPKRDKERTVPATPELLDVIDGHEGKFPAITVTLPWRRSEKAKQVEKDVTVRLLCTTGFGNPIRYNTFNVRSWKPALAAAGVIAERDKEAKGSGYESSRENGFHVLRHTFATAQLRFGVSIVAVSRWLGHKDPSFTLRKYVHFLPADDERGRQAMQSWWGKTP